eukprot:962911-Prymnesium_polylepis.1
MWPAQRRICLLRGADAPMAPAAPVDRYRSSSRFDGAEVDVALELLSINDHQELQRTRVGDFTKAQRTWAALAQGVAAALGRALLGGGALDETLERCDLLGRRLEARDAIAST